ncbi:MAG: hypothetical protein PHE25_06380 [Candidatus Gracilibacteria bacterium]|nr:hypothetical protein [Candidatus Gracilibacteria bacterium]
MNKKVLEFIIGLYEYKEFKGLRYSLTINYKKLVEDFRPEIFDFDALVKIEKLIYKNDVESFNFTLYDKYPVERNNRDFNFEYDSYWYSANYIFHGENDINCQFYFISEGLSINQLPEKLKLNEDSVLKLIEIGDFYKETSQKLYKLLNY